MTKVLGFDISSSTIGYCLLNIDEQNEIKLIMVSYIKPTKDGSILDRLHDTRTKIKAIIDEYEPDEIAIEDIIQFMGGGSTANTIITLTSFNRMIGLLAYDYLQRSPKMYNVMSIRHGLKIDKILPKKEDMPELVATHLGITFPYELNKKGKQKKENEDMADAISVALHHSFFLTGKTKTKGKK